MSVGSAGNERQIVNVADGTADTDAINVRQLNTTASTIVNEAGATIINQANAYTDQLRADMNQRFGQQDVRIARVGAINTAMSQAAGVGSGLIGENRLSVGTGMMGGQSAVALNYQRAFAGGRSAVSAGGALGGNERTFGAGAGISW
jgi:autotransporter adhesin